MNVELVRYIILSDVDILIKDKLWKYILDTLKSTFDSYYKRINVDLLVLSFVPVMTG